MHELAHAGDSTIPKQRQFGRSTDQSQYAGLIAPDLAVSCPGVRLTQCAYPTWASARPTRVPLDLLGRHRIQQRQRTLLGSQRAQLGRCWV